MPMNPHPDFHYLQRSRATRLSMPRFLNSQEYLQKEDVDSLRSNMLNDSFEMNSDTMIQMKPDRVL